MKLEKEIYLNRAIQHKNIFIMLFVVYFSTNLPINGNSVKVKENIMKIFRNKLFPSASKWKCYPQISKGSIYGSIDSVLYSMAIKGTNLIFLFTFKYIS